MKKLKALSRAIVVPALVMGSSFAPFALSGGPVSAAATQVYWAGTGSTMAGANTNGPTNVISLATNWSTTAAPTYTAAAAGFDNGTDLVFDAGSAGSVTTTGSLTNNPAEVEVVAGAITIGGLSAAAPLSLAATGGELLVDDPSTAGNSLSVSNVAVSGPLTIDGINSGAGFPVSGTTPVTGPVTLLSSDNGFPETFTAANVSGLLGPNAVSAIIGANATLTLAKADFGANAISSTIQTDAGGIISLTGAVPNAGNSNKGNLYSESFFGNGGTFKVTSGTGTVTLNVLTLNANSLADVPTITDVLAVNSGNFTPGAFSFAYFSAADKGVFPGQVAGAGTGSSGGTGAGAGAGTGAGAGAAAPAATPTTPAAPKTGFALVSAKAAPVLATTATAAIALFFAARRMKPAAKR